MTTTLETEIARNIEELRHWLASHQPHEGWTHGQRQAYADRTRALAMWLARSQQINR